jgi:endonuclease/exonuclease/phosphatase family metal-dependent hydrolase
VLCALLFGDKTMSIASYNVENLFDLHKDGYEYQEYIPNTASQWNKRNYKIKLKNIAQVIADLNPDIIALQEIESLHALKDLRQELKNKGVYYQYYTIADKKNTTVKVALLSKLPFSYSKELQVNYSYKYRNILETKFLINNKELYIFTNHWKSKGGPESERIRSAKALLKRIKEIGDEKNIILLGDFNSHYEEHKIFLNKRRHNDTNGKTGINHVLKTLCATSKASDVTLKEDCFYNLWYDQDEEQRYSYIYKKKKEALDNILISPSLLQDNGIYFKQNSMSHFKPAYLIDKENIYRWQSRGKNPRKHLGKGYSDHLPIKAEFVVEQ